MKKKITILYLCGVGAAGSSWLYFGNEVSPWLFLFIAFCTFGFIAAYSLFKEIAERIEKLESRKG